MATSSADEARAGRATSERDRPEPSWSPQDCRATPMRVEELADGLVARGHAALALARPAEEPQQHLRVQVLALLVDDLDDLGERRAVVGGENARARPGSGSVRSRDRAP